MLSLKNISRAGRLTILPFVVLTLILTVLLSNVSAQDDLEYAVDDHDKLAYVTDDHHLILHDPRNRTETTLLDNVGSFKLGRDGRVAFTIADENDTGLFGFDIWQDENNADLYVFDPSTPELAPIIISQNPTAYNYPLAWSPDGRYLAFGSFQGYLTFEPSQENYEHSLYIWDGETIPNISQDTAWLPSVDWSYDGRLAFTALGDIYIWDSRSTINLSQNPEGSDGPMLWSTNGQLMFKSEQDEEEGIYVWDGVSFKDGSPDVDSFIRLAPELQPYSVTWLVDSIIAFTLYPESSPFGAKEIILWDLPSASILRRIPVSSEYYASSLADGGQVILSDQLASGLPSVYLEVEDTAGNILFSTHTGEYSWSADGYLAYCAIENTENGRNWALSIWDGKETWVVARTGYRPIQWQHGRGTFSCNNG